VAHAGVGYLPKNVSTPHVLVVEDDLQVAATIRQTLLQAGFSSRHVVRASEIGDALARESFDLLLADIHLPDDSELAFLARIESSDAPRIPVILVTGHPTIETAVRALRHGVVDYLQKPFEREDLIESVRRGLKWRQAIELVERAQRDAEGWLRSLRSTARLLRFGGGRPHDPNPEEGAHTDAAAAEDALADLLVHKLSAREREVVDQLAAGFRVSDIASAFEISQNTVRNHLKSIFRKLGVSSQVELLARLEAPAEP
jgi:FixJ family two-component response regulator